MFTTKKPGILLIGILLGLAGAGGSAYAREGTNSTTACSHDMTALLSGVTIFGVASWGENWVEYHNPDGTTVLSNVDLSNPKRGSWSSENCLEVCYGYVEGGGWCPQWQEVDDGWVNLNPETNEMIHFIYLIERGDVMGLENLMDQTDEETNAT